MQLLMCLVFWAERRHIQREEIQCYLSLLWLSGSGIITIKIWLWLCLCMETLGIALACQPFSYKYFITCHDHSYLISLQVLGHICYHMLAAGLNGYLATVTNLKNPVNKWRCAAAPMTVGFSLFLYLYSLSPP